ncbi:DUF805 domain-containing protein [Cognatilysobacter lacus]|uniref:DUF805 domain-containing protein n=1 Tax=Cognatilysobacter lacus TaxID=1643323 RepID=A0A5D8Z7W4_9GAMM|nr:DUF805 domain-containing protein [Lysobacter lacus]TZF90909.1 DUF805 domain-containing protein [Lysobacter lacus]
MTKHLTGWTRRAGRLRRRDFLARLTAATLVFVVLFVFLERVVGFDSTLALYPPYFAVLASLFTRRLHDQARSAWWLLVPIIPVLGPVVLAWRLLLTRGTHGANQYGDDPRLRGYDYLQVAIHEPA